MLSLGYIIFYICALGALVAVALLLRRYCCLNQYRREDCADRNADFNRPSIYHQPRPRPYLQPHPQPYPQPHRRPRPYPQPNLQPYPQPHPHPHPYPQPPISKPKNFVRPALTLQERIPLNDDEARQAKREADIIKVKQMREIQARLVQTPFTAQDLGCNLLIGVDANPTKIGGYCVHLRNSSGGHQSTSGVEMYTFKTSKLPWTLHETSILGDSQEFEMKNLLFALLLWENDIQVAKTFSIYTDNYAVNSNASQYGKRVQGFIAHLRRCKGVKLCNPQGNMHANRISDPEGFARFIQPADDLSRWEISIAETFLTKAYGVQLTKSSHHLATNNAPSRKPYYKETPASKEILEKVKRSVEKWRTPCRQCHYSIEDSPSLHSIVIRN